LGALRRRAAAKARHAAAPAKIWRTHGATERGFVIPLLFGGIAGAALEFLDTARRGLERLVLGNDGLRHGIGRMRGTAKFVGDQALDLRIAALVLGAAQAVEQVLNELALPRLHRAALLVDTEEIWGA
jgi:hypothetical protein